MQVTEVPLDILVCLLYIWDDVSDVKNQFCMWLGMMDSSLKLSNELHLGQG